MVCLGNICRSPLAEGILKDLVKEKNLDWEVDSAGTAAYHVGELPDPRSIEIGLKYGIDIRDQKARKFEVQDFFDFDKILVMDKSNYANVLSQAPDSAHFDKVKLILDYNPDSKAQEVPDPYYGGKDGFDNVFNLLFNACIELVKPYESNNR